MPGTFVASSGTTSLAESGTAALAGNAAPPDGAVVCANARKTGAPMATPASKPPDLTSERRLMPATTGDAGGPSLDGLSKWRMRSAFARAAAAFGDWSDTGASG
jgi:hypothetical protein